MRNAASGETVTVVKGNAALTEVPAGVVVVPGQGTTVTVNGVPVTGDSYTVPARYYYYNSTTTTTTDTKADGT